MLFIRNETMLFLISILYTCIQFTHFYTTQVVSVHKDKHNHNITVVFMQGYVYTAVKEQCFKLIYWFVLNYKLFDHSHCNLPIKVQVSEFVSGRKSVVLEYL